MLETRRPVGVILGGGRGLRIGGSKLAVALRGRPLISYPLAAMRQALPDVAVIVKADAVLPDLPGTMVWIEPDAPRSPLLGIVEALALAGSPDNGAPAVVASRDGVTRPLLGCYRPRAAGLLAAVAQLGCDGEPDESSVRAIVDAIGPSPFEVADALQLFDVDTPDDLLQAAAMLP